MPWPPFRAAFLGLRVIDSDNARRGFEMDIA